MRQDLRILLSVADRPTTARVVIVLVTLEVLREVADATREHGDLDLGATGVLRR